MTAPRKRLNQENIYKSMKNPMADWMTPIELPTNLPVGLYGRQSSLYQVKNNLASNDYQIKEQKKLLIERYGWHEKLIIEYFDDFAFSGTLGIGERVGITRLTEDIEAGVLGAVYVFLEDRLFRDRHLENVVKFARICFEQKTHIITTYCIYRMWLDNDKNEFIEACKRAWEQFDTQINKRMIPMRAYKAHAGYYDSRGINIGYIVDKDQTSPAYNRYIIYEPHAEVVRWLYTRFIELSGNLARLGSELEQQSVHFPWLADSYFNKKMPMHKVPGVGYTIGTWKTLKGILTNKVYMGVWKAGDDEYPNNHPAIVDEETWHTVQNLMNERASKPRTTQKRLDLLSGLIARPGPGFSVSIEPTTSSKSKKSIAFRYRKLGVFSDSHTEEIHYDIIEATYKEALTTYIQQDDKCIAYAQEAMQVTTREERNKLHIKETIEGLQTRHKSLYNDATDTSLPIPKEAKRKMYGEMAELEAEIARLEAVLKQKKATLNFPEIVGLIEQVRKHWDGIPIELLHELATTFTKDIRFTLLAPHCWEMHINWKIWGQDTYFIWQSAPTRIMWSEEDTEILKHLVEKQSDIQKVLEALPKYSYDSICTKCLRDYKRPVFPFQGFRLDSCLTIKDVEALTSYNIPMAEIAKLKGMTRLGKGRDGKECFMRPKQEQVKSKDGAFFISHTEAGENVEANLEPDTITSLL